MDIEVYQDRGFWCVWYKTIVSDREFVVKFDDKQTALDFVLMFATRNGG